MKRILLPLILIFTSFLFMACDDSGADKVSVQDAMTAYTYSSTAYSYGVSDAYDTGAAPGVTYEEPATGQIKITFSSYDISSFASPYTSISGTVVQDTDTLTATYDVTLAGGPVYSLYVVQEIAAFTAFEVNGKDMLSELYSY